MITKSSFPSFIVLFLAISAAACLSPAQDEDRQSNRDVQEATDPSGILDGKKFIGPTGEKGKKAHHEDILIFKDGRFTSSACFQYGFTGGPYTATIDGDRIYFQAETVSPTHGKMVWTGTLMGETLDVTYTWKKKRWLWTTFRKYWFKGTLKK